MPILCPRMLGRTLSWAVDIWSTALGCSTDLCCERALNQLWARTPQSLTAGLLRENRNPIQVILKPLGEIGGLAAIYQDGIYQELT